MKTYETVQGDTWDIISYKMYGDTKYMDTLIDANTDLLDVFIFSAGTSIIIPELTEKATAVVPPWKE